MCRLVKTAATVVFVWSMLPLYAASAAGSMQVNITAEQLSFTGVTAGGRLVLMGLSARNVRGMLTKQQIAQVLIDSDENGVIAYEPPGGIPVRSVWVAADLTSGALVTVAPPGYRLDHHQIELGELKKDSDQLFAALELERIRVDLLLVRPGEGAWILHAREGGGGDGDGAHDGRLTLLFEQAQPLGDPDGKAPKKLKAGDVLAVIDRGRLEVRTLTVGQ